MESIHHWVQTLAGLWLFMLIIFFALGNYRSVRDDKLSLLFTVATISSVLPIIQASGQIGGTGLGEISWGFPFVSYFGFFLFFCGIAVNWIGIWTLKKQWSVMVSISADHKLIDTGVYKFIRHPIYTAYLLEILGFGIALSNWVTILALLLPNLASLAFRIFVEEKLLESHFGDEYRNYERRTKRLIPGIF